MKMKKLIEYIYLFIKLEDFEFLLSNLFQKNFVAFKLYNVGFKNTL
jgi:hypothetical protein